jgi:DNA excision repair protein ERCC-3
MPPKRKAQDAVQGAAKTGKASKVSTPGAGTPRSIGSSDEYSDAEPVIDAAEEEKVERLLDKLSVDTYSRRQVSGHDPLSHIFRDSDGNSRDFSNLSLKPDYKNRPLWVDPEKGRIILESFNPLAAQAQDFLITIAEPQSRPSFLHEYSLTPHSLYAAVSVGLSPQDIIDTLDRFLKTPLPSGLRTWIQSCSKSYGKAKLVLKNTKYFVESPDPEMLQLFLKDPIIGPLRVHGTDEITTTAAPKLAGLVIPGTNSAAGVRQAALQGGATAQGNEGENIGDANAYATLNEDDDDEQEVTHAFEIPDSAVETVQKRCLDLGFPMLEEYEFRRDETNPNLEIEKRASARCSAMGVPRVALLSCLAALVRP